MTDHALFPLPNTSESSAELVVAARKHFDYLEKNGALGEGWMLHKAIVLELADSLVKAGKGYARAQLAKELGNALDRLPAVSSSDAWETWQEIARTLATPAGPSPEPRYATPPTPGAAHQADGVAFVAALLGKPLLPWQYQVARVATERTPDGTRWRYRRVVVTVPRQSGKTTLLAAMAVHRALTRPETRWWLTAQTGKDATQRWNDLRALVQASVLRDYATARLSAGSSGLRFERTASHISPFAPTPESLHGYTFDNAAIDEAFAFTTEEGKSLLGAIQPAMVTLPDHQIWVTSTAGTPAESPWLQSIVENGRESVGQPDASVAYFEWSGNPAEDPDDPAAWAFHPAVGWTMTAEDVMELARAVPPSERDRAFRNLWVAGASEPLLPLSLLAAGNHKNIAPPPTDGSVPVAIGFDVDHDGRHAAIYSAWPHPDPDEDETIIVQPLACRPGMDWLLDELVEVLEAAGPRATLATPPGGASVEVAEQVRLRGIEVTVLDSAAWARSCGSLYRRISRATLHHPPDEDLKTALTGAATRPLGDEWAISRARSTTPVSPWGAVAAACRVLDLDGIASMPMIEGAGE